MEFVRKDVKYPYCLWTVQEPTDILFLFYYLLGPPVVHKVGSSGFYFWSFVAADDTKIRLKIYLLDFKTEIILWPEKKAPRAAPGLGLITTAGWRCAGDSHPASVRTLAGFPSLGCWQSVSCPDISFPGWTDNKLGNFHHLPPGDQVGKLSESTS